MKSNNVRMHATLIALIAASVVSFVVGRSSVEAPKSAQTAAAVTLVETTTSKIELAAPAAPAAEAHDDHDDHAPEAACEQPHVDPNAPTSAVDAKALIDHTLAVVNNALAGPGDHHATEAAQAAAGALEVLLQRDPSVLAEAIRRFPTLTDKSELDLMATLLARVSDPAVEFVGLHLTKDPRPAMRTAAFTLLDGLDTPLARPIVLRALDQETDQDARRAALFALPPSRGASSDEASDVVSSLTRVLEQDQDPEARRRAALRLAEWHRDAKDMHAVVRALRADASVDVRAGCAFALELAQRRTPQVVEALVASMSSRDEDPTVQQMAWRALGTMGPLPSVAREAFLAYELSREAG